MDLLHVLQLKFPVFGWKGNKDVLLTVKKMQVSLHCLPMFTFEQGDCRYRNSQFGKRSTSIGDSRSLASSHSYSQHTLAGTYLHSPIEGRGKARFYLPCSTKGERKIHLYSSILLVTITDQVCTNAISTCRIEPGDMLSDLSRVAAGLSCDWCILQPSPELTF